MERDWQLWDDEELVADLSRHWERSQAVRHREQLAGVLEDLLVSDPECRTLLDFGSGTGNHVEMTQDLGLEYTGADVTPAMIKFARSRYEHVEFIEDDILASRLANCSYDIVLSSDVLVHLPEFERPFATLYRLARRYVVIKLCYLTRRKGPRALLRRQPSTFARRNSLGFIERFFNIDDLQSDIERLHPGCRLTTTVFASGQKTSPFQAIVVITKPGLTEIN